MANLIGTWLDNVGTALNLPEKGWSEKYGVTSNYTALQPSQSGTVPVPYAPTVTGYNAALSNKSTTPTGTTPLSTSSTSPTSPTSPTAPTQDPNAGLFAEIDNIYNTMMGVAGERESTLRSNQSGIEGDITAQYGASQATGEQQLAEGQRGISQSEAETVGTRESALSAGKRLYNELSMGGQARFGGASSAGQAYSELTGREFQRGQGDIWSKFQTAQTKITDLKANLQGKWDTFTQNLEVQKNTALNEARRYFQDKLGEIDSLRAEAAVNKSQQRLEVLQTLRNQIYNINLATSQTLQTAQQQKTQNETYLKQLESQITQGTTGAQQATGQLSSTTTTNPQTAYNITSGANAPAQQLWPLL